MPSKLYFHYGVVSARKSAELLSIAYTYRQQGKKILLLKPSFDTRFGSDLIKSRNGLEEKADIIIDSNTDLLNLDFGSGSQSDFKGIDCILVDEVSFLENKHIYQLREIADYKDVPVMCFGLRTNYLGDLFPASKILMEIADQLIDIKTTCWFCNRRAIMNLKYVDGIAMGTGDGKPELGGLETYLPACHFHWNEQIKNKAQYPK